MPSFAPETDTDETERVPLSLLMEEILLGYFYLLTKREVLRGDRLVDFWGIDSYHLYSLLNWEHANMENEPTGDMEGTEKDPVVTGEQHIPQDPEIAGLFPEFDDPENEEEL